MTTPNNTVAGLAAVVDTTISEAVAKNAHGPRYGVDWIYHDDRLGYLPALPCKTLEAALASPTPSAPVVDDAAIERFRAVVREQLLIDLRADVVSAALTAALSGVSAPVGRNPMDGRHTPKAHRQSPAAAPRVEDIARRLEAPTGQPPRAWTEQEKRDVVKAMDRIRERESTPSEDNATPAAAGEQGASQAEQFRNGWKAGYAYALNMPEWDDSPIPEPPGTHPEARGVEGMVDRMIARYLELEPGEAENGVTVDHPETRAFCRELLLAAAPSGVRVDDAMADQFMARFNCEAENTTGTRLYETERVNVLNALTAALSANEVSRG